MRRLEPLFQSWGFHVKEDSSHSADHGPGLPSILVLEKRGATSALGAV
jgi:hypothetical protein